MPNAKLAADVLPIADDAKVRAASGGAGAGALWMGMGAGRRVGTRSIPRRPISDVDASIGSGEYSMPRRPASGVLGEEVDRDRLLLTRFDVDGWSMKSM